MQVVIDQIVSRVRTFDAGLSPQTMRRVIAAALEAVRSETTQKERIREEHSLKNAGQRCNPWSD